MRKFMHLQDLTIGRTKPPLFFSPPNLLHSTASMDLFDPLRSGEKGKDTKRIVLSPFWKGREDREEEEEEQR